MFAHNHYSPTNRKAESPIDVRPKLAEQSSVAKTPNHRAEFRQAAGNASGEGREATVGEKDLSLVQRLLDRSDNRQAVRRAVDIAKKKGMNPSQQTVRPISG